MTSKAKVNRLQEFTWGKLWASAWGGAVLGFFAIPDLVWVLLFMMGINLIMGAVAEIAAHAFVLRRLGDNLLRKTMAFLMLGGIKLMAVYILELKWDAMQYFAKAMISYEFLSSCAIYIALGAPGAPALDRFRMQIQAFVVGAFGKELPLDHDPEPSHVDGPNVVL